MNGPLQPGNYVLMSAGGITDRYSNNIMNFARYFVVTNIETYALESRFNNTRFTATPIKIVMYTPEYGSGFGRGTIEEYNDIDYWKLEARAGRYITVYTENPGYPSDSALLVSLEKDDGEIIAQYNTDYYGFSQSPKIMLTYDGTYYIRLSGNNNYNGEYRVKVTIYEPQITQEQEINDVISNATPVNFQTNNLSRTGQVAGYIRISGETDWYNLGVVSNGYVVYVSVNKPNYSKFVPVVGVYNSAGIRMAESGYGNQYDGVAEVLIT